MLIDVSLFLRRLMGVGGALTAACVVLFSLAGIPGLTGGMEMSSNRDKKSSKWLKKIKKEMEEETGKWEEILISHMNKEKLGLPEECKFQNMEKEYIECNLSGKDLEKIKFKDLGDNEEVTTVSPNDNVNVNLEILINRDFSRNYTFTNDSKEDIVISKGDNSVTLKAKGETSFILDGETLVIEKLGDYGIPERCLKKNEFLSSLMGNADIKQCDLTEEELSKIKFHGFSDGEKSVVTKFWVGDENKNWEHDQFITLIFRDGKYNFYNHFPDLPIDEQKIHRPIKITRGNVSVTLDGNMESEFTVVEGALKKQEVTVLGFPKRCEMEDEEVNESCELFDNDIRRLKLKETGVSPHISYLKDGSNRKMKLRIEKTEEDGFTDKRKYILSPVDSDIVISGTAELSEGVEVLEKLKSKGTLLIEKGKEKVFKNVDNSLVLVG